jgi:hypothetical protein
MAMPAGVSAVSERASGGVLESPMIVASCDGLGMFFECRRLCAKRREAAVQCRPGSLPVAQSWGGRIGLVFADA